MLWHYRLTDSKISSVRWYEHCSVQRTEYNHFCSMYAVDKEPYIPIFGRVMPSTAPAIGLGASKVMCSQWNLEAIHWIGRYASFGIHSSYCRLERLLSRNKLDSTLYNKPAGPSGTCSCAFCVTTKVFLATLATRTQTESVQYYAAMVGSGSIAAA